MGQLLPDGASPASRPGASNGRRPVVVLDAGHGGSRDVGGSLANRGVASNGLLEKDLVLDLARRVAGALGDGASVVLTRSADENVGLADRASTARRAGADVFVSL